MDERRNELGAILAEVRRRWTRRVRLAAWTAGAAAAAVIFGVGLFTVWLLASEGLALAVVSLLVTALALVTVAAAARPLRRPPSDLQLARYIEEQAGGLDDVVVTAVQHGALGTPIARLLAADAAARVGRVGLDDIISAGALRRAATGAGLATLALAGGLAAFAPTLGRGAAIAAAYLLPSRILIDVTPGTSKVREGRPVTITARLHGLEAGLVPELTYGGGDDQRSVRMTSNADGTFTTTFEAVTASFPYAVVAGPARSETFTIEAIRPARVARIDVRYRYPAGLGLEPRVEEDGGDIYAPAGTSVELTVTTDKPIASGTLTLADGSSIPLSARETVLDGRLAIRADGAYRVALTDVDGLENAGDTEYFIRMLNDRPPDVRVVRPGGDKQVTPIEEVVIEARAEDDFGLSALEIVFQAPGMKDTVVPLETRRQLSASGSHMVQLEELGVAPGDFVTYYARAGDVGQGRRGAEARSDIFFLEVKPFEEEFVAAQSQAMSMQGGGSPLQDLAEAQKEIIAATWKLDARARRARNAGSEADIRAVAQAQSELRARAAEAATEVAAAMADPGRRRPRPGQSSAPGADDPMARAVEAMGRAAGELERLRTTEALPHEMAALEQLLKANADVQRRQVSRQQQAGGGGSNRSTPDLSTLFDQQLRKQQQTNYETPDSSETREEQAPEDDALARVRELARRQEALQRAQRDLARGRDRLSEDEVKRQLERLTREQQELTRRADELSKQMQQPPGPRAEGEGQERSSQQAQGQPSASGRQSQAGGSDGQSGSRQMREIAEHMRNATGDLRRQDPDQASARSGQAVEQLRDLSQQMERARPDERRRAMGDLQFEARQLADAERRLAAEADRASAGGDEARRRLAAEQERLADRTERLSEAARQLGEAGAEMPGGGGDTESRQAARQAADDIARERLAERMRASADALRQKSAAGQGEPSREMARALDRIAGQLGEAAGTADRETERLSGQLARANELRDQIGELQQTIEALQREAGQGRQGGRPSSDAQGQPDQAKPGSAQGQEAPQGAPSSQPGGQDREGTSGEQGGADGGRAGRLERLQREATDRMREARRLAGELREQNPDMRRAPAATEDWYPSLSAPGTESFKQDFARWETLKTNLLLALERTETRLSGQLRERETRERLNAGGHQGVSNEYREMVDRYYQSLAAPRKPPR
ncbi:MAG: hypothetical protein IT179_15205 [Acidobacteria bacterium]|nr:hypothetical protein [Acidobacteriota bacterium]